jgi:hypothetical protein
MRDDIDQTRLDSLIRGLGRPIKSLDWREFHFFKEQGLSKTDLTAIRVCHDYELARESSRVLAFVKQLSPDRRRQILEPQRVNSRYIAIRFSDEPPNPKIPAWSDVRTFSETQDLFVPAACVAASWFPRPWLCGSVADRRSIVKRLTAIYTVRSLPVFDFPVQEDMTNLLLCSAQRDGNTTLHVLAIDWEQTKSALLKAFEAWLEQQRDIKGSSSRQGKNKFASALSDLGCYRLMTKLEAQARAHAMNLCCFRRSIPKLSEAKTRTAKRLQRLGYINLTE